MKGLQFHRVGLTIPKLASIYPVEHFLHFFLFPTALSNLPSTCPEEHFVIFFQKFNFFEHWAKIYRQGYQNCTRRVHSNASGLLFFQI